MRLRCWLAAAIAVSLLAGACGGDDDDDAAAGDNTATSSGGGTDGADFDGQVKFGFIAERTGVSQSIGIPNFNSSSMAVQKINDAGGIEIDGKHYEVVLDVCDSGTEEARASACAIQLTEEDDVKFMFGGIGALGPLVLDVTEQNDAIYFASGSSTAARLPDTNYLFATVPGIAARVEFTMRGIREFLPDAKTMAGIYNQDATSEAIRPLIQDLAAKYDFDWVGEEVFPTDTADIAGNMTNLRGLNPDVLWAGTGTQQMAAVIQANKEIDAAPAVFSWATSCKNAVDADADRTHIAYPLAPADLDNPQTDEAKQFVEDLKAFTGEDKPENVYTALWNYDFFFMLRDAIQEAGTFEDVDAVRDALLEMDYEGLGGPIHFGPDRQAIIGAEVCMYPGEGGLDAIETKFLEP